jgi:anti-sigma factor RsiW
MNCADFERLLALDVEGDLPGRQGPAVAEHLLVCPSCRRFAERLKFSQSLLKALGQETPDEATLQEVRLGILNRLPNERIPRALPAWRFALGAGAVAVLLIGALILHPLFRSRASHGAVTKETRPALAEVQRTPELPHPIRIGSSRRAKPRVSPARGRTNLEATGRRPPQLTIQLLTDDPNVTIYWLVD